MVRRKTDLLKSFPRLLIIRATILANCRHELAIDLVEKSGYEDFYLVNMFHLENTNGYCKYPRNESK